MLTLNDLTPREREVALLVAEGLTNKAIADQLTCSDQTVKNHVTNIALRMFDAGMVGDGADRRNNLRITIARWIWEMQTKGPYPGEPEREVAG